MAAVSFMWNVRLTANLDQARAFNYNILTKTFKMKIKMMIIDSGWHGKQKSLETTSGRLY